MLRIKKHVCKLKHPKSEMSQLKSIVFIGDAIIDYGENKFLNYNIYIK